MERIVGVSIDRDSCLLHGCCVQACPEVFGWPGKGTGPWDGRRAAFVREGSAAFFDTRADAIREACVACPVAAIRVQEE